MADTGLRRLRTGISIPIGLIRVEPGPQEKLLSRSGLEGAALALQLGDIGFSGLGLAGGIFDEFEKFPQVFFFR